jgi:hypothetical protein
MPFCGDRDPLIMVCDATEIIKNATEELRKLSLNGFQEYFQQLYSPLQQCIVPKGTVVKEK